MSTPEHPSWHPRGRVLEVAGRRTHLVDVGEGPPVLLLHGFLHSSYTWRENLEALAAWHRVLAADLPGFGWGDRSPGDFSLEGFARHVEGLLDALGVERLHGAVGNSLGGGVLLQLALSRPARVGRLVLVSSLGLPLRLPRWLRLLGHPALGGVFRLTAGNPWFVAPCLRRCAYKRRPVDADVLAGFAPLRRPGSHRVAVETVARMGEGSAALAARLAEVRAPSLVVWGQRDGLLPVRYGERLAAHLPAARLEVFEDCGHCAHEEDPQRFNALVEGFLRAPAASEERAFQTA